MGKYKPSMLGEIHALKVLRSTPTRSLKGVIGATIDLTANDLSGNDLSGNPLPNIYTFIIYGIFEEGQEPTWYWCDEFGNTENPPVLAAGYDGTTALRDGIPVNVSGTFYQ